MPSQIKAVIDTSVLVRILASPYYLRNALLQSWQSQVLTPIACSKTLTEFANTLPRVIRRRRIVPTSEIEERTDAYPTWCQIVADPATNLWPNQCRDEDDQVFLDLAVAAAADLIISDDPDIRNIPPPHPVPIIGRGRGETIARELADLRRIQQHPARGELEQTASRDKRESALPQAHPGSEPRASALRNEPEHPAIPYPATRCTSPLRPEAITSQPRPLSPAQRATEAQSRRLKVSLLLTAALPAPSTPRQQHRAGLPTTAARPA